MTRKFASIELARLYEAQGYLQDALAMYKALDDDVLEGGAEVRAAVKRLELALLRQGEDAAPGPEGGAQDPAALLRATLDELNGPEEPELPEGLDHIEAGAPPRPRSEKEERIAVLMEKWLALMVVRKRLKLFRKIRARV